MPKKNKDMTVKNPIIAALKKVFKPQNAGIVDFQLTVQKEQDYSKPQNQRDYLVVKISQMYAYVGISFEKMSKMSAILHTKDINLGSQHSSNGCDVVFHLLEHPQVRARHPLSCHLAAPAEEEKKYDATHAHANHFLPPLRR